MKPLICKVFGDQSEGTGFVVNSSGLVLTAAHIKASSVEYQGRTYTVQEASLSRYNPKNASVFDLQLLEIISERKESFSLKELDFFELPQEFIALEEGEEVYFGGYPLTQKFTTFHK